MTAALVVAEHRDGHLAPASLEALGAALGLGPQVEVVVRAALFGQDAGASAQALLAGGADAVDVFDDPALEHSAGDLRVAALAELVAEQRPDVVLFPATSTSRDVAARLAARLETGLVSECVGLVAAGSGRIAGRRAAYGGRILEDVEWTRGPRLALLRAGAFAAASGPPRSSSSVVTRRLPRVGGEGLRFLELRASAGVAAATGRPDLVEARVVVAAGRGLGAAEALSEVERFADALGAAVGASRAVVDAGWLGHAHQVGQTGRTVAPELYVACGISGAVQHLAGMSGARLVVAINRDAEAPIFGAADYGIVGDVHEVLPRLIAALHALPRAVDEGA